MNLEILNSGDSNEVTMTSVELVELINDFREKESSVSQGNRATLEHKTFMAKIREELDVLVKLKISQKNILPSEYINSRGRKYPCYELNRDGCLQMLNSESILVRHKTIEYINKLESQLRKVDSYMIENKVDRAKRWIEEEEEKERLRIENQIQEQRIAIQQPKVDNYDSLLNSDGLIDMQEFVKSANLTLGRTKFMALLRLKKILMQGKTIPLQSYIDREYFIVKQVPIPNGSYVPQSFLTRKGLDWMMKKCREWDICNVID